MDLWDEVVVRQEMAVPVFPIQYGEQIESEAIRLVTQETTEVGNAWEFLTPHMRDILVKHRIASQMRVCMAALQHMGAPHYYFYPIGEEMVHNRGIQWAPPQALIPPLVPIPPVVPVAAEMEFEQIVLSDSEDDEELEKVRKVKMANSDDVRFGLEAAIPVLPIAYNSQIETESVRLLTREITEVNNTWFFFTPRMRDMLIRHRINFQISACTAALMHMEDPTYYSAISRNVHIEGEARNKGKMPQGNDRKWKKQRTENKIANVTSKAERSGFVRPRVVCFNCAEKGHMARECKKPKVLGGWCFNCGQTGHHKSQCTKTKAECSGEAECSESSTSGKVNVTGSEDARVEGTLSIVNTNAKVLFDTDDTHTFTSSAFINSPGIKPPI